MLKFCCCGCSLEIGGRVLGWLGVIGSGFSLLRICHFFLQVLALPDQEGKLLAMGICLGVLALFTIPLAVSILLLVGIANRRHSFLLPYLIFHALGLIVLCFVVLYVIFLSDLDIEYIIAISIGIGLNIGMNLYFWFVIYSLYHEIRDKKIPQTPQTPQTQQTIPLNA